MCRMVTRPKRTRPPPRGPYPPSPKVPSRRAMLGSAAMSELAPRILYRDAALTDARSDRLQVGVSVLVEDGVISWIRPSDAEEDPGSPHGLEVVDAHSHLTLPGGAHWIDRIADPPEVLLQVAERNGELLTRAGVRWARDVG